MEDVLEEYGLSSQSLNIDDDYIGETISYLILSILERFPRNGESLTIGSPHKKLLLTIEDIEDGKIESIRVEKA